MKKDFVSGLTAHKKGDIFEFEGKWYIAVADSVYQDKYKLEEYFDQFIPESGYSTTGREAVTPEEVQRVQRFIAAKEQEKTRLLEHVQTFAQGESVRFTHKGVSKMGTVRAINNDLGRICIQPEEKKQPSFWMSVDVVEHIKE